MLSRIATGLALLNPAATAGGFLPTQFAGLLLWLRASSISLNDGDLVSTWLDESGNNNHATNSGSVRPAYKVSILNGLPIVRFTIAGASQLNLTSNISGGSAFTVFAVLKETATRMVALGKGPSAATELFGVGSDTQLLFRDQLDNGVTGTGISGTTFGYYTGQLSGGTATVWRNGTQPSNPTGSFGSSTIWNRVGMRDYGPAQYSDGDLAEVLFYDSALSTSDRQTVENYLKAKYGL